MKTSVVGKLAPIHNPTPILATKNIHLLTATADKTPNINSPVIAISRMNLRPYLRFNEDYTRIKRELIIKRELNA